MKRNLSLWQFAGFCLTALGGTLLHFAYEWSGNSLLVAPFSGVNESTWEHMKLLYFPLMLFAVVQSRYFRETAGFWWIKLVGILTGILTIPALYYVYNGAVGLSPDWLNITFFFLATAGAFLVEWLLFRQDAFSRWSPVVAVIGIVLIGVLFVVFTFWTPPLPLFRDPVTGKYGVLS